MKRLQEKRSSRIVWAAAGGMGIKMKKRTFFVVLVLFLVFLNSMILIVSLLILRDKLSAVRDKCLAEHYVIASSLIGDIQALEQRGTDVKENMDKLMRSYSRYLQGRGDGLGYLFQESGFIEVLRSYIRKMQRFRRIQATGRNGLSIWKMRIPLCYAFMEAFRLPGRIMD